MNKKENKDEFVISFSVRPCNPKEQGFIMERLLALVEDLDELLELNEHHQNFEFCAMIRDFKANKSLANSPMLRQS